MKTEQDKLWNELSEDYKEDHRHFYKTYKDFAEETNFYTICRQMEKTFGTHNLSPKPQIKTWEDVEKEYPDLAENLYKGIQRLAGVYENCEISLLVKCDATLKIAKLIDLGYGGIVSEEEWKDEDIRKFSIVRFQGNLSYAEGRGAYEFISFHTPEQREEFMSHESNKILVEQYYMM